MSQSNIKFAFFGSSRLSVIVLDSLYEQGFVPSCIITTPDKPQGRHMTITPNVVKDWANKKNIHVHDVNKLDQTFADTLTKENLDIFIVASYGKIIPENVLSIPPHKTLNIHPSLLPLYRGPSPLPSSMIDDAKQTGISIMRIDAEMDHGPLLSQKEVTIDEWPTYENFEEMMAKIGAEELARILPDWIAGKIKEQEQDHSTATHTKKIQKEDAEINIKDDAYLNFRKIQAYHEWPQAYFFIDHNNNRLRVKITEASFQDGKLNIEKVIPEGKKEMSYEDFTRGYGVAL